MFFPPQILDEIRSRLPVSQVVARRVKLRRQGREFIGLSPFKVEKTPSFTVNDQKGFYHCFATGEHGDIFRFLMTIEGLSFPEAVERLAAEAGVSLPRERGDATGSGEQRSRIAEVVEASARFFEEQLQSAGGRLARATLDRRGITAATRKKFRFGYAPEGRSVLKEHLARLGFSAADSNASGMLVHGNEIPVSYDRFRHRLMIPITDAKDRPIAFGGRVLDPEQKPKYLNSPETPLFHKGGQLFNLAKARTAAHDAGTLIVVEGYMDAIALDQGGFANAVAPLGTALTPDQLALLWRFADEPVLCFDGDSAGRKAAFRAIDTSLPLLAAGKSLRFAFMPDGLDPDDLLRQEGPAAMRQVLTAAKPLIDVLWDREIAGGEWSTPERRAQLEQRLSGLANSIADQVVRGHYARQLRERLWQQWRARPAQQRGDPRRRDVIASSDSLKASTIARTTADDFPTREALIVRALLSHPSLIEDWAEEIAVLELQSTTLAQLRDRILVEHAEHASLDSAGLMARLRGGAFAAAIDRLDRSITHRSDGILQADAAADTVDAGWRELLQLQQIAGLRVALDRADNYEQIVELKQRLSELGAV